jgi:hypothetical protein
LLVIGYFYGVAAILASALLDVMLDFISITFLIFGSVTANDKSP